MQNCLLDSADAPAEILSLDSSLVTLFLAKIVFGVVVVDVVTGDATVDSFSSATAVTASIYI